MNTTFIYLGNEVKIDGNKVTIRSQDGSIEKIVLKYINDADSAEFFIKEYMSIKAANSIVKQ